MSEPAIDFAAWLKMIALVALGAVGGGGGASVIGATSGNAQIADLTRAVDGLVARFDARDRNDLRTQSDLADHEARIRALEKKAP